MKKSARGWAALFLLAGAVLHLPAQQGTADAKLLAEMRARAEAGDAQAQFEVANVLDSGRLGVAKDEVEAVKWLRKAAEQDYAQAQCALGCCYYEGRGVARDYEAAFRWFREAAERGLAVAQYDLSICYANDQGVARDATAAALWLRRAAEANCAQAQNNLGVFCHTGQGVAKDDAEAVKWYRRAASRNDLRAEINLGLCYATGQGVARNHAEAIHWFRKAAGQNCAEAQTRLGLCYARGEGVARNYAEAFKWFRQAAGQNCAEAQYALGYGYYNGQGTAKDYAEAARWFRRAAEQGWAEAQDALAYCCYSGQGVAKDPAEAAKWYRRAAEQGWGKAQEALGLCCAKGQGVPKDYVQACLWLRLAAAQGDAGAKQNGMIVERLMTAEQVAEARKLARDFRPSDVVAAAAGNTLAEGVAGVRPEFSGTGFFITEDGYLITNERLAEAGAQVQAVTEAGMMPARVVKVDAANDLALLKVDGTFTALPVLSSEAVKAGGTIAAVGFPSVGLQGFAPKLAKGRIATAAKGQEDRRCFQVDVPVQPGNSGGALVDQYGNVVGVLSDSLNEAAVLETTGALAENVNYALKSSLLLGFLESQPEISAKLTQPNFNARRFEDVVESAGKATALVVVH